jgi:phosphoesterase RecJ-like protein
MPLDWSPLVEFLRRHDRPLLMTHIRPDADGLGSQLALHDALTALGKEPRVAIASKLLPRYEFLDPARKVIEDFRPAAFADRDCVVVLDTGTWNQLGDFGKWLQASPLPRAVVDHHRTQDDLGGLRLVDITAEATGRLAHELIRELGAPVGPAAANNLFMAVATDTGWFRHPNTTPATFALCGELVALGANPTELYERLYEAATLASSSPPSPWTAWRRAPAGRSPSPRSGWPTTPPPARCPATRKTSSTSRAAWKASRSPWCSSSSRTAARR